MTSFQKIGVVGAGMMGSEIALMFALAEFPTQLSDVSRDAAGRAMPRALLRQMVDAGYNGRKAGRGWYGYDGDGKKR
jgi:3-hydroxybutyryl-CoA dehydrogenase